MTRQQVLDLYFLDARHKLVDLAAFLDRVERAGGKDDFRLKAFRTALDELSGGKRKRAKRVLLAFSDPTTKPVAKAEGKGACGAARITPLPRRLVAPKRSEAGSTAKARHPSR